MNSEADPVSICEFSSADTMPVGQGDPDIVIAVLDGPVDVADAALAVELTSNNTGEAPMLPRDRLRKDSA